MDSTLVNSLSGLGLHADDAVIKNGLTPPTSSVRKQRSQRFTVPVASPPRQPSSSSDRPVDQPPQTVPALQEYYPSTLNHEGTQPTRETLGDDEDDDEEDEGLNGERQEYEGSSASSDSNDPLPPPPTMSSNPNSQSAVPPVPPQYHQQRQSFSSHHNPLSPPSLYNLPGSPGFTYHHSSFSSPPLGSNISLVAPPSPPSLPQQQFNHGGFQFSSSSSAAAATTPSSSMSFNGFDNTLNGALLGQGQGNELLSTYGRMYQPTPSPGPPPSLPLSSSGYLQMNGNGMMNGVGGGGNRFMRNGNGNGNFNDGTSDDIIETAIVIKSIPFACPKDQLLALMASLSLPTPLAFNYHYDLSSSPSHSPSDTNNNVEPRQDQFRGLAFANYRNGEEAKVVVLAMNGFEFMGRKLRAEFKKVLKPGEKELIERNKALKRIRSVQQLGNGNRNGNMNGNGFSNWNDTNAQSNGFLDVRNGGNNNGNSWNAAMGGGSSGGGWNNRREASAPGGSSYYRGGAHSPFNEPNEEDFGGSWRQFGGPGIPPHQLMQQQHHLYQGQQYVPPPPPRSDGGYSSGPLASGIGMALDNSGESFVGSTSTSTGTSRSGGIGGGGGGGGGGSRESGSDSASVDTSDEGIGSSVSVREERRKDLDLNDPQTLQLYSQLLLFSSTPSPPGPQTYEMEGLDSLGRIKVKKVARMLGLGYGSEDLQGRKRVRLWKTGQSSAPQPQQPLRSPASSAQLRRPASVASLHSTPTSSSSFAPPPVPALPAFSAYLSAGGGPLMGLRGKKSMPEFRQSSHSSNSSFYSNEPPPPMPTNSSFTRSQSHSNGLARRSTNNLRTAGSGGNSFPSSSTTNYSATAPASRRTREIPSVQGLFQQQGILADNASSPSPGSFSTVDGYQKEFYSTAGGGTGGGHDGRAEAVRQPRGPGTAPSSNKDGMMGDGGMEWRNRRRI